MSDETVTNESPKWIRPAWLVLTMVSVFVLALYVFIGQNAGDRVWFPGVLLVLAIIAGSAGVAFRARDQALSLLLMRVATLIAIVGILTFML